MKATKSAIAIVLAGVMCFGAAGVAVANVVTYNGTPFAPGRQQATSGPNAVEVRASVNPKITLTITTPDAPQTVNFGAVDPDTTTTRNVGIQVQSNKAYDFSIVGSGDIPTNPDFGFTRSLVDPVNQPRPGATYTDIYSITPNYNVAPGNYTGTVVYTVVQQ